MFHGRISLNCASAATSEFCKGVQVGTEPQVKPHSSLWFSATCAAAIVHRHHFFHLYQQDKSSDSKVKFRQARGFLKLPNLHIHIKQKSPLIPTNLALGTFDELLMLIVFSTNLLYLLYSLARKCCLLHLIKQNCLLRNFSKNSNLDDSGISFLFSLRELI